MLELAVFLCGAVIMVLELTGSRVLAPYLGTSIVVWTSLIGVVLGSLSLGYWWGGRLADRRPEPRLLSRIILLSAVATLLLAALKGVVLAWLQNKSGIHTTTLASTVALFAPVSVLLGMVSPFAVRLRMQDAAASGRTAGNLYALSTLGSIAGTFGAGFWLTATLGTTNILLCMAGVLVLASVLVHRGEWGLKVGAAAFVLLMTAILGLYDAHLRAAMGVHDIDTPYQRVLVYTTNDRYTGRLIRVLATGPEGVQSAAYADEPAALAVPYTRYYRLAAHFRPGAQRMLMLGGGGLSFPKYLVAHPEEFPGASLDVVEIDPGMTEAAREFLGFADSPAVRLHHDDARRFLSQATAGGYQVALVDVFTSHLAVPFHLTTVETLRDLSAALDPDGVVLVNCISPAEGPKSAFYRALLATYRQVFPRVESFLVQEPDRPEQLQNIVLAAFKNPESARLQSSDSKLGPELGALLASRRDPRPGQSDPPALTDDFAPVDHYLLGL